MSAFLFPIIIITILVLLNGLFVAAEFCIISVRPTRLAQLSSDGNQTAHQVKHIVDDPTMLDRYIATSQVGVTVASLSLGMYGEHTVASWLLGPLEHWLHFSEATAHSIAIVVAVSLLTFAHVVVGEMVPKSLALQYAERTALGIHRLMLFMKRLFYPMVIILNSIGNMLLWLLRVPQTSTHRRLYSPEELEMVVTESHKGGLLGDDEQQIIQKIFDLDERRVGQVMTPRPRIVAIPVDISEEELRTTIASSPYSRFPVFQDDMDHIVGLLLMKDFVKQQLDPDTPFDLKSLLRHMPAVPEAMSADRLLAAFKHSHIHMALVFDEYGGTAGVVTLEDLVEEVMGEVRDEFDQIEQPPFREVEPGVLMARGDLMLDDLLDIAPESLPESDSDELPDVDTVGGLVVSLLERPPDPGDQVTLQNTTFTVEGVSGYAIKMVRIEFHSPDEQPGEPEQEPDGERGEP